MVRMSSVGDLCVCCVAERVEIEGCLSKSDSGGGVSPLYRFPLQVEPFLQLDQVLHAGMGHLSLPIGRTGQLQR